MPPADSEDAVAEIRALLDRAVKRLSAAGARDEALAEWIPEHRVLLIMRPPVLRSLGRVWRLGVFLLGSDGTLYETGLTTRALEPGRPAYQSQSAEQRRAYRAAANRGRFAHGETVNFDATEVVLDVEALATSTGRLFLNGDKPFVRWSNAGADAIDLAAYVEDRVQLLVEPPGGA